MSERRVCATCGWTRTKHDSGICNECRSGSQQIALTGGEWVPDRNGILRWQSSGSSTASTTMAKACPTCHATMDQTCRTRSGHKRTPHQNRLTHRYCPCGAVAPPKATYCTPCAEESLRASKRESQRRLRAAQEVA